MCKGRQWYHWFLATGMVGLMLMLAACDAGSPGNAPLTISSTKTSSSSMTDSTSTASFTLSGGATGSYTINTTPATSKLRHGHQEFTIYLTQAEKSILVFFIGYSGPASYTLSGGADGGEVRIAFGKEFPAWDLSPKQNASCSVTVTSDTPTLHTGIDRIKGSFSCPVLTPSYPDRPEKPIVVSDGQFDVAMIVES